MEPRLHAAFGRPQMKAIQEFFSNLSNTFPTVSVVDVLDILLVAGLVYYVIDRARSTSAFRIVKAIGFLVAATFLTELLNFHAVNFLLDRILQVGFVALVIVFQPELRRLLERVGSRGTVKGLINLTAGSAQPGHAAAKVIGEVVTACELMSHERVGALIAFERTNSLQEYSDNGTQVDGAVTQELIRNIFFPKAALHDGAMIIYENRIKSAGCVLPLSENTKLSSDLGTRHRAGVGLSERTDAVVVIVSEETGAISVAVGGMLKRHLATQTLERLLLNELGEKEPGRSGVLDRLKRKNNKKGGDGNASAS